MKDGSVLNEFFVRNFNMILLHEQRALSAHVRGLSVNEMHVIAAVCALVGSGKNTMASVARSLSLTAGALSVAVSTLVRKGYLVRVSSDSDRRQVYVFPTDKGRKVDAFHENYHKHMVSGMLASLDESELTMLNRSLDKLCEFFENDLKRVKSGDK